MKKAYVYDIETYPNFFCCTLLSLTTDEYHVFIIDKNNCDSERIKKFFKNIWVIGYNNLTYDNLMINYIIKNDKVTPEQLNNFSNEIITFQNKSKGSIFKEYSYYIHNDEYKSIDLMRLLFSKKLRVGLKELECSMNHEHVEELPHHFTKTLTEDEKMDVLSYNMNDCIATKKLAIECMPAIKLRHWTLKNFKVEGYSLDGVNLGTKILEERLALRVGNKDFAKQKTERESVSVKKIIYPHIKFETKEFNEVLNRYKKLTIKRFFDEEKNKKIWTKFKYEPIIRGYQFKFGVGGLHFNTQSKAWISDKNSSIYSIDVESYYPSQLIEYPDFCKPEHLPDEFVDEYHAIKTERLHAKSIGDDVKNETYKLAINGAFGNLNNEFSWLYDVKALLSITINGQLMLAMLCEKLILAGIQLIDVNTDGIYIQLKNDQRQTFDKITKEWSEYTKMILEETKFERIYFLTTGDYFGEYIKKGKIEIKEKGAFITKNRLGKGMEFPIIYSAVKSHFLNNEDFKEFILKEKDILKFCSFKKLKREYTSFWKGVPQQRVNRFYASRQGAHLFRRKLDVKSNKYRTEHMLKDSPVQILNKLDNKSIKERSINYSFYFSKTREIITQIEGDKTQLSLFH